MTIRSTIEEIRVGFICYPLRQSLHTFLPGRREYLVAGFSPTFVGRGDTEAHASLDWTNAVHAAFQELLHKRPFETRYFFAIQGQPTEHTILSLPGGKGNRGPAVAGSRTIRGTSPRD